MAALGTPDKAQPNGPKIPFDAAFIDTEVERFRATFDVPGFALAIVGGQALAGDPAQAEADLARDEARWPKDTLRNAEYGPEARAILELRRGDPQAAVRATSAPDPFEWRSLEFPYVRALALLAAGDGPAAAGEFRAVLAHSGWSNWPQYGLAHLGLARALRLQHDAAGARRE